MWATAKTSEAKAGVLRPAAVNQAPAMMPVLGEVEYSNWGAMAIWDEGGRPVGAVVVPEKIDFCWYW